MYSLCRHIVMMSAWVKAPKVCLGYEKLTTLVMCSHLSDGSDWTAVRLGVSMFCEAGESDMNAVYYKIHSASGCMISL